MTDETYREESLMGQMLLRKVSYQHIHILYIEMIEKKQDVVAFSTKSFKETISDQALASQVLFCKDLNDLIIQAIPCHLEDRQILVDRGN